MIDNIFTIIVVVVIIFLALATLGIFYLIKYKLNQQQQEKLRKLINKTKVRVTNAIHQTIINTAIPVQVSTFHEMKKGKMYPGVFIISFFVIYPIFTYFYMKANLYKMERKSEDDLFK